MGTKEVDNLHTYLTKLAQECDQYEDFRERALARTPDVFKASIGPHLLEWYVEFRYPEVEKKDARKEHIKTNPNMRLKKKN